MASLQPLGSCRHATVGVHPALQTTEGAQGGLCLGEEDGIGLQAHVQQGIVDVHDGDVPALELYAEEGIFV